MTDLSFSHSPSATGTGTGKIAPAFARLIALLRTASAALAQVSARNAERNAARRAPEEILMAHARREEARRARDRLMLLR